MTFHAALIEKLKKIGKYSRIHINTHHHTTNSNITCPHHTLTSQPSTCPYFSTVKNPRKPKEASHEPSSKNQSHHSQIYISPTLDQFFRKAKMANLMKRTTKDNIPCKKHPKHRQSPGVCSLCLREKLSQLPASTSSSRAALRSSSSFNSSSVSSYYSSSSVSSYSSPMHGYRLSDHRRKLSLSVLLFGGPKNNALTKSRSLVIATDKNDVQKVKKSGFFSKLLIRNKKIDQQQHHHQADQFLHSRTMREITVVAN